MSAKGLQQILLFSLRNFGGMLPDLDAFLQSSPATSFSISANFTVLNEKLPLTTFSLINLNAAGIKRVFETSIIFDNIFKVFLIQKLLKTKLSCIGIKITSE